MTLNKQIMENNTSKYCKLWRHYESSFFKYSRSKSYDIIMMPLYYSTYSMVEASHSLHINLVKGKGQIPHIPQFSGTLKRRRSGSWVHQRSAETLNQNLLKWSAFSSQLDHWSISVQSVMTKTSTRGISPKSVSIQRIVYVASHNSNHSGLKCKVMVKSSMWLMLYCWVCCTFHFLNDFDSEPHNDSWNYETSICSVQGCMNSSTLNCRNGSSTALGHKVIINRDLFEF